MKFFFTSSLKCLLLNLKIEYLLTPWKLTLDFVDETMEARQRNWFLVGYKTKSVSLRFIKNINIYEHLFGADIFIRTMGEDIIVKYIDKKEAEKIKTLLLEFNKNRGKQIIIA